MRGYTGSNDLFHDRVGCPILLDPAQSIPETKAMKWDINYCPECFPEMTDEQ